MVLEIFCVLDLDGNINVKYNCNGVVGLPICFPITFSYRQYPLIYLPLLQLFEHFLLYLTVGPAKLGGFYTS